MAVNLLPPMSDDDDTLLRDLFTYLSSPNPLTCRQLARFGGQPRARKVDGKLVMDGQKFACLDPEFGLRSSNNCLVYSFGIAYEWSFDWDMERFRCNVRAFDPFVNQANAEGDAIQFTKMAIGDKDERRGTVEVRTLDSFVDHLGHSGRTIHYLKMDVESSEYGVLHQQVKRMHNSTLFRNVEQIGVELHFGKYLPLKMHMNAYRDLYEIFLGMQELGFYLFSYEPNLAMLPTLNVSGVSEPMTPAMEVAWLKTSCVARMPGTQDWWVPDNRALTWSQK